LKKPKSICKTANPDSAEAVFDLVSKNSPDRLTSFQAEAKAAFTRRNFREDAKPPLPDTKTS